MFTTTLKSEINKTTKGRDGYQVQSQKADGQVVQEVFEHKPDQLVGALQTICDDWKVFKFTETASISGNPHLFDPA